MITSTIKLFFVLILYSVILQGCGYAYNSVKLLYNDNRPVDQVSVLLSTNVSMNQYDDQQRISVLHIYKDGTLIPNIRTDKVTALGTYWYLLPGTYQFEFIVSALGNFSETYFDTQMIEMDLIAGHTYVPGVIAHSRFDLEGKLFNYGDKLEEYCIPYLLDKGYRVRDDGFEPQEECETRKLVDNSRNKIGQK